MADWYSELFFINVTQTSGSGMSQIVIRAELFVLLILGMSQTAMKYLINPNAIDALRNNSRVFIWVGMALSL
jgi:hypothetical protein